MARRVSQSDPALSIDFFNSGFFTYRSQLFAPFKNIGINVVQFKDPVIDGINFELTDKFEWQRRPGFSIFCPIPLSDTEIVNQFYSSRNLDGLVTSFVDTSTRLASFTDTSITTILPKTTLAQGYIATIGQRTYFADGAPADSYIWNGSRLSAWGLAAPTIPANVSGLGFWQPETVFALGNSILDPNGAIEVVTAILIPNGSFESPTAADNMALAGSLPQLWQPDPVLGGYYITEGYKHIQQAANISGGSSTTTVTFPKDLTVGNVIVLSIGVGTVNFTPSVVSVTDSLGNVYNVQAHGTGTYHGGGGRDYIANEWVYSADVTTGGPCFVTVTLDTPSFQVAVHEFSGISATITTSANNFEVNSGGSFDSGGVTFSGTKLVYSAMSMESPAGSGTTPFGYTPGNFVLGSWYLQDAYFGQSASADPIWQVPPFDSDAVGITCVFPITSLTTGHTRYLYLHDFNLSIPAGVTIVGILVTIPKVNAAQGTVVDYSVKLVIGGVPVGTDMASAVAWSNSGYVVSNYGGPSSLWGLTPTPAQLNANGLAGFGVVIAASITATDNGSITPEVGFTGENQPTVTVYYKNSSGTGGPGITGLTEPIWPTNLGGSVNDGGLTWTNYGPIGTWLPATGYPTPIVVLDANGNLQLSTYLANTIPNWDAGATYAVGDVVYFGGAYWLSLVDSNTGVTPSNLYATTGTSITQPYWAQTPTPLVTGTIVPVWNTTVGGMTVDGSYTWTNVGQGSGLAFMGYAYVYGYRTVDGHISTCSPFSSNTGAILGPLNGSITAFQITANVVTFTGNNNFLPGNVFQVRGLSSAAGLDLNEHSFTVLSAMPSESFPLTTVAVTSDVLTIGAINNLTAGQKVTFNGVTTATFLNGVTVTVIATGLSSSQFEANFTHADYGPADDSGTVDVIGSYTANFTHPDVALTLDAGESVPIIANVTGLGTASPLCNSTANITSISVTANIVTVIANNNFQPGIWVTMTGLTGAPFLNNQLVQVISVDQSLGTQNTQFQVYFQTPNYVATADSGVATFDAIEIYRTSDGGGTYLFTGAVVNPLPNPQLPPSPTNMGGGLFWSYDDFTVDADLDALLIAPLNHQNDPPPGAPGSTVTTAVGTVIKYWQGRLWMIVGNYVYFDAGPDCTNGIPEEAWPPGNRFQYAGPPFNIEPTADGVGMLVYLADRVAVILGGPETISFYSTDALSNFGIANPNALFRDGSVIGLFSTQKQYFELAGAQKNDIGERIGDYLADNFDSTKAYATMHRDGLDVGVFISNGVDQILRYGSNIQAWSVPCFPAFGAGAVRSIETSVGVYSLMAAAPRGGKTSGFGPINPSSGTDVDNSLGGPAWTDPSNITLGNPADYAVATFSAAPLTSHILRASSYVLDVPSTAVVQGIRLTIVGKQLGTGVSLTVKPTGPIGTSHTFSFGATNTTVVLGGSNDLWGMPWMQPYIVNNQISFDITASATALGTSGFGAFDTSVSATGKSSTATISGTPSGSGEIALLSIATDGPTITIPAGWSLFSNGSGSQAQLIFYKVLSGAGVVNVSATLSGTAGWAASLSFFQFALGFTEFVITNIQFISANSLTVTCVNNLAAGNVVELSGLTTATFLNTAYLTVSSATPTSFVASFTHAIYPSTPDTGIVKLLLLQQGPSSSGAGGSPLVKTFSNITSPKSVYAFVEFAQSTVNSLDTQFASASDDDGNTYSLVNACFPNDGLVNGASANIAFSGNTTISGDMPTVTVILSPVTSPANATWYLMELPGGTFNPVVSVAEVQVTVTYQNPGNYLYARDLNSWGDDGIYAQNNGSPYAEANIVIGSLTLSQPGALMFPLQHVVGYFDAVGTLNNGGPSNPDIWILPNEVEPTNETPFIQLPEVLQEPPIGQTNPSKSILALRWPVNMLNSSLASQYIHHMQVRIQFEPELAPNTIKALAFKETQD